MSDDLIEIEVDGKSVQAKKGQMIIEATDTTSSYVPRFCYPSCVSFGCAWPFQWNLSFDHYAFFACQLAIGCCLL